VRKKDAELLAKLAAKLPKSMNRGVAVVGAGLMGTGIAQVTAQAGLDVTLVDVNQSVLDAGLKRIHDSVARVAKKAHPEQSAQAESFAQVFVVLKQLEALISHSF
jgi:3-hydroxyacyl-CoA dehydrogenase